MGIPCGLGVMPQWFGLGLRHGILGSCPGQYAPLNRPCFESGTHSFASSDGADCRAPPHWRSRVTTCHQETCTGRLCGDRRDGHIVGKVCLWLRLYTTSCGAGRSFTSTMPSVGSSTYVPGPNMVCSPEKEGWDR